jgi:hypothetical protein
MKGLEAFGPNDEATANILREQLNGHALQFDQKQMDEMKQQMQDFQKNFKPEDFKVDPQLTEQLRKQTEELRDQLKNQDLQFDQKQMDEFKPDMKQFQKNFMTDDLEVAPL